MRGETSRQNRCLNFVEKEPIYVITEVVGPKGPKLSPKPVQASGLTLRSGTQPGSPLQQV
jgi:hypothetical protein